jgi:nitric oxide reductase NorD protein
MSLDKVKLEYHLGGQLFDDHKVREITELILQLDPRWQDFVLHSVLSIARAQPEIALLFTRKAATALRSLGRDGCEDWLQLAMNACFDEGQQAALDLLNNLDQHIYQQRQRTRGLELADVRGVLQYFMHGLDGRKMSIEGSKDCLTDSETLLLPFAIDHFSAKQDNFACYKAIAVHQWAQCRYGTWRADTIDQIPHKAPMLQTFHYVETLRLNACIARDYPGLERQMKAFQEATPEIWQAVEKELAGPEASVIDSIRLSHEWWDKPRPDPSLFQGKIDPARVHEKLKLRLEKEARQLRRTLGRLAAEHQDSSADDFDPGQSTNTRNLFEFKLLSDSEFEFLLDGNPVMIDDATKSLTQSILQDRGNLPDNYLDISASDYQFNNGSTISPGDDTSVPDSPDRVFTYDEWDYERNAHRENWCRLREVELKPDYQSDFVRQTLIKYHGQMKSIRRSFEALREEYRILKKQPDGENPDLDAQVEAICDVRSGMEMTSRLYRKAQRIERNIAVIFMIDMSGSTKGWINIAQREALVLLAEAMKTLDDRYAIYGFSGTTRKRCDLYRVKTFDENYGPEVHARIAAIEPQDYTRMGVTIRHLSHQLDQIKAKTKLLITLSDGKPDDYDSYSGKYGIEDTRMALLEARQRGINPFCITIDEQARDYLPHMFGSSSYVLIDDINKLPYRISEIYRGLTS